MITRRSIDVLQCVCERCGRVWETRVRSVQCPGCHSSYWDRPRKGGKLPASAVAVPVSSVEPMGGWQGAAGSDGDDEIGETIYDDSDEFKQ